MRYVEAVVAAEGQEQVVACDRGDRPRLEAEQLADTVILVDDVVAGTEVGEGLQSPAEPCRLRPARALAEELGVGEQREVQLAPDEAAARGRDREQELGAVRQRLARLEQARLDTAEQVERAQRLAAVREGDDDAVVGPE